MNIIVRSVICILLITGCATAPDFSTISNKSLENQKVALIKDDYFHWAYCIRRIEKRDPKTGEYVEIYNKDSQGPFANFRLSPGTYYVLYGYRHYKISDATGEGVIHLKAGHKYRVGHVVCYAPDLIWSKVCRRHGAYTATVWFEDLTNGEVLSGEKW